MKERKATLYAPKDRFEDNNRKELKYKTVEL